LLGGSHVVGPEIAEMYPVLFPPYIATIIISLHWTCRFQKLYSSKITQLLTLVPDNTG